MKKGISKNSIRRKIALALTVCMSVGSAGCSKVEVNTEQESVPDLSVSVVSQNDISVSEPVVREKIDDNGQPIRDFDEFVNGEWKKEQEGKEAAVVFQFTETAEELWEGVCAILDEKELEGLSEEDGLYKMITIYDQLADTSDTPERIETFKTYLAQIENARTLDDLYRLYEDDRYAACNTILNCDVANDGWKFMDLTLAPFFLEKEGGKIFETEEQKETFVTILTAFDYSESRARTMVTNLQDINEMIAECRQKEEANESGYVYMNREIFGQKCTTVPVFDILGEQYAGFCPGGFDPRIDEIWITEESIELLNTLYRSENLQKIKDYHMAYAVYLLGAYADPELYKEKYDDDVIDTAKSFITIYADELLVREYMNRNIEDVTLECCDSVLEEVKQSARTIVDDAEWLSLHGKEQARSKILHIRVFYGGDTAVNDYSDMQITENSMENVFSLLASNYRFYMSHRAEQYDAREIFDINDYVVNAFYYGDYNAIVYTTGWLKNFQDNVDLSEEESLGILGTTMAHELGHAYDTNGSLYDSKGEYNPWMSEEEAAAYEEKTQQIADFFDGWETEYGRKIDGELVKDETFADLMAVECCLRILAEKEDPDYDAFFRTYARNRAEYYTEEGLVRALTDTHLPGKERINLVLGQFDRFYETYDIDENSPYYVKEADRLPVF